MPDGQNIIDIGYDVEKLTAQQKIVVEALTAVFNLAEQIDGRAIAPDIKGIQDFNNAQAKATKGVDEVGLAVQQYNKLLSDMAATQAKASIATSNAATTLASEKAALQATNAELKASAQLNNTQEGSIARSTALIKTLTLERNKLNLTTDEGKKRAKEINELIDEQNDIIQNNSSNLEKQKINVGNYSSILSGYATQLKGMRGPSLLLGEALGVPVHAINALRVTLEHSLQTLSKYFASKETKKAAEAADTMATNANTVATEVNARAKMVVARYAADTPKLLIQTTAATETATVATELNTAATELNVEATAEQAVASETTAVAMETQAVATEGATVATESLFAVLAPIVGIIALIVAPLAIIGKLWWDYAHAEEKAAEASKELFEAQSKLIDGVNEQIKAENNRIAINRRSIEDELSAAEKSGQSQEKIFALKKKLSDFDKHAAETQVISHDATNEGYNKELKLVDAANEKLDGYNKRLEEAKQHKLDMSGKNFLMRWTDFSGEDEGKLKILADAAQAEANKAQKQADQTRGLLEKDANAKREVDATALEEEKFTAEQKRKIKLESVKLEVDLSKARNAIILSDETSTMAQRIAAMKSNAEQERKLIEADKNDVLNNPSSSKADRNIAIKKAKEEEKKLTIQSNNEISNLEKSYRERRQAAEEASDALLLQSQIKVNDEISADTKFSLEDRLNAVQESAKLQKKVSDDQYKFEKQKARDHGATIEELALIDNQYAEKQIELAIKVKTNVLNVLKSQFDEEQKDRDENLAHIKLAYDSIDLASTQNYSDELIKLNKSFSSGEIGLKEYTRKRRKIDEDYKQATIKGQESLINNQIDQYKDVEKEHVQLQQNLINAEAEKDNAITNIAKLEADKKIAEAERELKANETNQAKKIALEKELSKLKGQMSETDVEKAKAAKEKEIEEIDKGLQYEQKAVSIIQGLVNNKFESQKNAIQEIENNQQQSYEKEVANIQNSSLAEADKANKLKILEAQRKAQKEKNDRDQKNADIAKAKFDKEVAIFQIIINTAAGIMKASPNVAEMIATGVIGAAELAVAASAPIPKYAEGTDNHPGGWAMVGEGKYQENVLLPSGQSFIADKPMVLDLPYGTSVTPITDSDINSVMYSAMFKGTANMLINNNESTNRKIDELKNAITWQTEKLASVYKQQKRPIVRNIIDFSNSNYIQKQVKW